MKTGTIKSFNADTGDGMITPIKFVRDVYFNSHSVEGGTNWVYAGVKVEYELYPDSGSSPEAKVVRQAKSYPTAKRLTRKKRKN